MENLKARIRDIPDFPSPGILFKDITPLVHDAASLKRSAQLLVAPYRDHDITAVAGMEARGFIFGALAASLLDVGFVPLRKPGKLPYDVQKIDYTLEYGTASLEAHVDSVEAGDRILLVDDVLATGGTAKASCELIEMLGGEVVACAFVVELAELGGRDRLQAYPVHAVVRY